MMAYLAFASEKEPRAVLLDMLSKGELCDLTVICQETHRSYRVHAMILLAMSRSLMNSMERQDNQDQGEGPDDEVRRLLLPHREKTIEALIKTAYEGADKVAFSVEDEEGLKDLIRAARQYNILDLTKQVAALMLAACSLNNMMDLHRLAKLFAADGAFQKLKDDITIFMAKNIDHIISSKAFVTLSVQDMRELLGNRHLQLTREKAEEFLTSWFNLNTVKNATRQTKASLTTLAKRPTTYRIPSSVLLAAGGWASEPTSLVEVFNLLDRSWSVAHLRSGFKLPGASRAYHGMEVVNGSIWLVGGFSQQKGFLSSLHEYKLPAGPWVERSNMSVQRCYLETQQLEGKIFAIGGHSGGNGLERLRSAEVYTIKTNQWNKISDMNHHRSDFASVVLHGAIYVMGGFQGAHYQTSIEKYNPQEDSWTIVGQLAGPRSGCSAVVANGKIYVLGGFNGSERLSSVECFSPRLGGLLHHDVPDMLHHRSNFFALLLDDNTIMVAGGFKKDSEESEGEICGDVELFNVERKVWSSGPSLAIPRSALQGIKVNNFYG